MAVVIGLNLMGNATLSHEGCLQRISTESGLGACNMESAFKDVRQYIGPSTEVAITIVHFKAFHYNAHIQACYDAAQKYRLNNLRFISDDMATAFHYSSELKDGQLMCIIPVRAVFGYIWQKLDGVLSPKNMIFQDWGKEENIDALTRLIDVVENMEDIEIFRANRNIYDVAQIFFADVLDSEELEGDVLMDSRIAYKFGQKALKNGDLVKPLLNRTIVLELGNRRVITIKEGTPLPVTEVIKVPVYVHDTCKVRELAAPDKTPFSMPNSMKAYPLPNAEQVNFTLIVGTNFLYDLKIEEATAEDALKPKEPPIPELIFWDNKVSVKIYQNGEAKLLKNDQFQKTTPIFISFVEKKPIVGRIAEEHLKDTPSSVVYDLIHIMSSNPATLEAKPEWKFSITKDPENPLLLNFDSFDGNKVASPAFLMAIVIKKMVKLIKKATNSKPTEVLITFKNLEPQDSLKTGLSGACKLLSIEAKF